MSATPSGRRRLGTIGEVCKEYLDRVVSSKTSDNWKIRRADVTRFMLAKGSIAIDDAIGDDLEKWVEDHPAWKSPWTRRRIATTIKSAFSFCWNKGLIDRHPFKGVSYPQGDRGKPMTEEQFRTILREVGAEFRRVLFFLWWTGCRPLELACLKWAFIDVQKAIAVLHEHKTAHSRKDRQPRVICLPEKAIRLLTWILNDQRDEQEYVFLNTRGEPWKRTVLTGRIFRLRGRLGLPKELKLYGTRSSFATRLALAGVELKTLATLMGHTNTKMCEHYVHLAGEIEHLHKSLEKGLGHKKDGQP